MDRNDKLSGRTRRRIVASVLMAALLLLQLFLICECGISSGNDENEQSVFPIKVDYSEESFSSGSIPDPVVKEEKNTLWIRDCLGRVTEVSRHPERIAFLDSFAGEAGVMTGAGDRIVTCPNGVLSDRLLRTVAPSLSQTEAVMSGGSFNAEALLQLSPDVVIIKEGLYRTEEEREKLEKLGIPYLVTTYSNMAEQIYALDMIGAAEGTECSRRAKAITAYYCDVIRRVSADASKIPEDRKARIFHSINEAVRTDAKSSLGYDWITCAGGIDVSADNEERLRADGTDLCASLEQIFNWDPDLVICNEAATKDYLLSDSKWTGLRAVREKQIYNIPVGATRWGQRGSVETFFAMIWLGTQIYPEYYQDFNLREEVTSFYQEQLGITVDDELYAQILAGTGIRNASQSGGQ